MMIPDKNFYLTVLDRLEDGIYYVDRDRQISFWNKGAEKITGYTREEMVGKHCPQSGLAHIDLQGNPLCRVGCPLHKTLMDGKERQDQVFARHKEGYRIPLWVKIFPHEENGRVVGAVEVFTQNAPTVFEGNLVDSLTAQATLDELTRLPNRRYTQSFLDQKVREYRQFGRPFALLFADIDRFRDFNNTHGHDVGDKVLSLVAETLKRSVRRNDLVGRWGGEEILGIYQLNSEEEAPKIGERFRSLVESTQIEKDGLLLHATVSVGVVTAHPGCTPKSLVEEADKRMYISKEQGRNRVTYFPPEHTEP